MLARIVIFACAVLAPLAASARDLYVNNVAGSDEHSGLVIEAVRGAGPVKTIFRALCLALPGDRIVIANTGEPYREEVSIAGPRLHGTKSRPLTLTSEGAVIDGTVEAAPGAWRHVDGDVFAMRPRRLTYQQLFRDGAPLERVRLLTARDAVGVLEPLQWALATGGVLMRVEKGKLPESYDLRHAGGQTGITLYNTHDVVIEGLVLQGFQQDGVNAQELVKNCVLRNVELRANGRSGLSVGGASRVRAEGCNAYDNGRAQVRTEGLAKLDLVECDIDRDSPAPAFDSRGGELNVDGKPAGE